MPNYSFNKRKQQKVLTHVIDGLLKWHIGHQNTVLFILGSIMTYLLAKYGFLLGIVNFVSSFGYVSIFALGFLFSFGEFTVPVSAAFYLMARNFNPVILALTAAIGSTISSFLIYKFVKHEILDEIKYVMAKDFRIDVVNLEHNIAKHMFRSKFLQHAIPILAGILSALPIPTQTMATILWTVAKADTRQILINGFIFSFIIITIIAITGNGGVNPSL